MIGAPPQAICPIAVQAGISALAACPARSVICIACRGVWWAASPCGTGTGIGTEETHSLSPSSNVEMWKMEMSQRNLTDRCLFLAVCASNGRTFSS